LAVITMFVMESCSHTFLLILVVADNAAPNQALRSLWMSELTCKLSFNWYRIRLSFRGSFLARLGGLLISITRSRKRGFPMLSPLSIRLIALLKTLMLFIGREVL
jgi:hypothetical protein